MFRRSNPWSMKKYRKRIERKCLDGECCSLGMKGGSLTRESIIFVVYRKTNHNATALKKCSIKNRVKLEMLVSIDQLRICRG